MSVLRGTLGAAIVALVLAAARPVSAEAPLGIAIVTQVRQTHSGDSLDTARPADLLVLLDSLRQREATLNTEVNELQNTLNSLQASGNTDQAAIKSALLHLLANEEAAAA